MNTLIEWVRVVCATAIGLFVGVGLMLVLQPEPEPVRLDFGPPKLEREFEFTPSDVMCTYHAMWLDEGEYC